MLLVYVPLNGKTKLPDSKVDCLTFKDHAEVLEEVLQAWHGLGRPECWLFFEVGQAPWYCAAETVRISPQRGKVSS